MPGGISPPPLLLNNRQGVAAIFVRELHFRAVDVAESFAGEDIVFLATGVDFAVFEQQNMRQTGEDFFHMVSHHHERGRLRPDGNF